MFNEVTMTFPVWILTAAVTLILPGFIISLVIFRRKRQAEAAHIYTIVPDMLPAEGLEVPVLDTLAGLKAFAPVTFAQNRLNPKLVLFDDQMDYKVLRSRSAKYSEIESVHSYASRYYNRLQFNFRHTSMFLMAVFANADTLKSVVDFLASKGIRLISGS